MATGLPLAIPAHAVNLQSVVVVSKTVFFGNENFHSFDAFRGKLYHFAALQTNEVLVMCLGSERFVPFEPFTKIVDLN